METGGCTRCNDFLAIEDQAKLCVDETILKAINSVERTLGTLVDFNPYKLSTDTETFWPAIEDFTIPEGVKSICNFVDTWSLKQNWLYCINYLMQHEEHCSDFYYYEVIWSIPTKEYPVPQATASVYFIIEVSRVKPVCLPIHVSYIIEGSRFIHMPNSSQFSEEWLLNILNNKVGFFQTLRF